ncbi:MAG: hypothetical protein ACP5G1_04615, partial [Nanopusillaceae archaeon]
MINKEILSVLDGNIKYLKIKIRTVKKIIREIEEKKEWLNYINNMYESGYLDLSEYKEKRKIILSRIRNLEKEKYKILYDAISLINEIKRQIDFLRNIEEKTEKENKIIEDYNKQVIIYEKEIKKNFPEIFYKSNVEFEKKYFQAEEVLFRKKEKKKKAEETLYLKRIKKKEKINYLREFLYLINDLSYKIFGKVSEYILKTNVSLYFRLKYIL